MRHTHHGNHDHLHSGMLGPTLPALPCITEDPPCANFFFALIAALSLSGCGYNDFQRLDEGVKAAWSEVLNNYQRRADLIPNLVATVQGAADFEKSTLVEITNARASGRRSRRRRN